MIYTNFNATYVGVFLSGTVPGTSFAEPSETHRGRISKVIPTKPFNYGYTLETEWIDTTNWGFDGVLPFN